MCSVYFRLEVLPIDPGVSHCRFNGEYSFHAPNLGKLFPETKFQSGAILRKKRPERV